MAFGLPSPPKALRESHDRRDDVPRRAHGRRERHAPLREVAVRLAQDARLHRGRPAFVFEVGRIAATDREAERRILHRDYPYAAIEISHSRMYIAAMKSRDDKPPRAVELEAEAPDVGRISADLRGRGACGVRQSARVCRVVLSPRPCFGEIQCAHVENGGMSERPTRNIAPLCANSHHADFRPASRSVRSAHVRAFVKLAAAQTQAEWDVFCRDSRSSRT
jgi:hypothetical protein